MAKSHDFSCRVCYTKSRNCNIDLSEIVKHNASWHVDDHPIYARGDWGIVDLNGVVYVDGYEVCLLTGELIIGPGRKPSLKSKKSKKSKDPKKYATVGPIELSNGSSFKFTVNMKNRKALDSGRFRGYVSGFISHSVAVYRYAGDNELFHLGGYPIIPVRGHLHIVDNRVWIDDEELVLDKTIGYIGRAYYLRRRNERLHRRKCRNKNRRKRRNKRKHHKK